jgi:arsenate reductase (glutaredoxin)
MIKVYGYKKCGTCRKAEKHFEAKGKKHEFIDITQNPPSQKGLKEIIALTEKPIEKFYNTSGVKYKEGNIKEKRKTLNLQEQIKLLTSDGYLLKRPLVTDGKKATVGFNQDEFDSVWK